MRRSLFSFYCKLCGKLIQNGTGAAGHGRKHVNEGRAIRTGKTTFLITEANK